MLLISGSPKAKFLPILPPTHLSTLAPYKCSRLFSFLLIYGYYQLELQDNLKLILSAVLRLRRNEQIYQNSAVVMPRNPL